MRRLGSERFLLVAIAGLLAISRVIAQPAGKSQSPPDVVFVCEHGAAKSVIAAAYFNKMATERGLPQRAVARGVNPDPAYSSAALQGLKNDGITIASDRPKLVTEKDLTPAAHIVTLGCKLPQSLSERSDLRKWDEVNMAEGYPAARDAIAKRVNELIEELAARKRQ